MTTLSTTIQELQEHEQEFATLETIHQYETQLQAAVEVAGGLKEENDHLRTALQDARSSNAAQQRRHTEWTNSWKKEVEVVSKREQALFQEQKAWDAKLADKRRQLDELSLELAKKKDESKRNTIQAEKSERVKIEHLEKEVEKWRKKYAFEAQKMSDSNQQMESKYLREAEMVNVLRKEITSLQKLHAESLEMDHSNQQANNQEKVRELKLKVDEMDLLSDKLRQEAQEMRKSRDEAIARCDELKANHLVELGASLRDCTKYEAKSVALQEQILGVQKEAKEISAEARGLEESLDSTRKDVARLKDALVARKTEHEEEVKQLRHDMMKCDHELRAQLSEVQQLLTDEKAKTAEAELRFKEIHEDHIQSIKQLAREFEGNIDDTKEKLLVAQDYIRQLESKLTNLEHEKAQLLQSHQVEMQRLKHACESCHNDLNLALFQKEEATKMLEAMNCKASKLTKQLQELERTMLDTDEQHKLLENQKLTMQRKMNEVDLENKALEQRLQIVSDKMLQATKDADVWKEKTSEAQRKAGEVVKEVKGQLSKEQRRSEAYKEKALEAHQRNIEAKRVLESLRKGSNY